MNIYNILKFILNIDDAFKLTLDKIFPLNNY